MFSRYSGLLHVRSVPSFGNLVPPSSRSSVLRGAGGLDDNLAFRLKRRRFVIETLNLGTTEAGSSGSLQKEDEPEGEERSGVRFASVSEEDKKARQKELDF